MHGVNEVWGNQTLTRIFANEHELKRLLNDV